MNTVENDRRTRAKIFHIWYEIDSIARYHNIVFCDVRICSVGYEGLEDLTEPVGYGIDITRKLLPEIGYIHDGKCPHAGEGEHVSRIVYKRQVPVWEALKTFRTVRYGYGKLAELIEPVEYETYQGKCTVQPRNLPYRNINLVCRLTEGERSKLCSQVPWDNAEAVPMGCVYPFCRIPSLGFGYSFSPHPGSLIAAIKKSKNLIYTELFISAPIYHFGSAIL